jgi:hypothetical protein
MRDAAEAEELFADGLASLRPEQPFQSAHLMVTSEKTELSYRFISDDGSETDWESVELDGVDPKYRQGLVTTDAPVVELQLRKSGALEFGRVEFFEDRLDEDYSFEGGHSSPVHELDADESEPADGQALRTRAQMMREALPGRWTMPENIARIANTQYVPVTNAGPWRGSGGCSGDFTRGAADLKRFVEQNFGGVRAIYGYSCRPINCGSGCTSSSMSVHATGRAIDIMIPPFTWTSADNGHGNPIAHYLVTNAKALGIQRVIWERSIWDRGTGYTRAFGGHPHADHLHVEITPHAARGLNDFPSTDNLGSPRFDMDLHTSFHGPMIDKGLSVSASDIPAVYNYVGGKLVAEMRMTNTSNRDLENVTIGYWIEQPYLKAVNYRIESDHPHHDQQTWTINSADGEAKNPDRRAMGQKGYMHMHKMSPGESKRVVVTLDTASSSIALADHPDVRFWVKHISDVYGEQTGFFEEPTNGNMVGRNLRSFSQVDVLDRDAWHFSGHDASETLGWQNGNPDGDVEIVKLNMNYDTLAVRTRGDDPYVHSPSYTQVHPWRWDELALQLRSHSGPHSMSVYWAHEDEGYTEEKSMHFDVPHGDSEFHHVVVPIAEHPNWEQGQDVVRKIRIDPHNTVDLGPNDSRWYDIKAVFAQSSDDKTTSSDIATYIDAPKVDVNTDFTGHFADDDTSTHEQNIDLLYDAGVVHGCNDSQVLPAYCPNDHLTRGALAAMSARAFDLPNATRDHFSDDDGHVLEAEINAAAEAGLTAGCSSDAFCPNEQATIGQLALFLVRGADFDSDGQYSADAMTEVDAIDELHSWSALDRSLCDVSTQCVNQVPTRADAASVFVSVMSRLNLL